MYEKLVKQQRKEVAKLTLKQQQQIVDLYDDAIKGIAETIKKAKFEGGREEYIIFNVVYQKELEKKRDELVKALNNQIKNSTQKAAEIGTKPSEIIMQEMFDNVKIDIKDDFKNLFSRVQDDIVANIISGNLYKDNKTLSMRVWGCGKEFEKDIQYVINQGILQKKSAVELAKDLEQFVKEPAKRSWDLGKVYPLMAGKKIEYNAMRLARTSINHAYQTATIQASNMNPYVEGIRWYSAMIHGRTCELCMERHGQIFPKDDVPLDHPNGLCTMIPDVEKSLDEIATELRAWVDGEENATLDDWYDKYGMYFIDKPLPFTKPKIDYAQLGKQIAFEQQKQMYDKRDIDGLIETNKNELLRLIRISSDEGVDIEKCKKVEQEINQAIEILSNYQDKYIIELPDKYRYRTIERKGEYGTVKEKIYFFEPIVYEERLNGMYYVNFHQKIKKKEREEILKTIDDVIMRNQKAAGIRIEINNNKVLKQRACCYIPSNDKAVLGTVNVLYQGWGGITPIGHELGHRPYSLPKTQYKDLVVSEHEKKEWKKLVDKYYEEYTKEGKQFEWRRFNYPLYADKYYADKSKEHIYSEMWAEVTSVLTSPDDKHNKREKELQKLDKYFPELKEFAEKFYGLEGSD